jgi:hypothetical protein
MTNANMEPASMLDHAGGRTAPGALRDLLRLEQVRLVYEQMLSSQLVAVLNAVVFVAVQSLVIAAPVLIAWLAAVCVLALIRIAGGIVFRSAAPNAGQIGRWRLYAIAGAAASGILWGSAAWLLFPPMNIAHQVFVAFILGGMVAGSVTTLAPVFPAFLAYAVLTLVPAAVRFPLQQDYVHYAMGWLILVFLAAVTVIARRSHEHMSDMLRLRIENAGLTGELHAARERLRRAQQGAGAERA